LHRFNGAGEVGVSSKIKVGGKSAPKTSEAPEAAVAVRLATQAPEAVEYGKGGVFRSVGGGKRVRVTG
jgi:hypothetical protein